MRNLFYIFALMTFTGCASTCNHTAADDGFFGTYKGRYIVINQSGGDVMDVWKLEDSYVEPTGNGAGWLFTDQHGNTVHLGGDVKVVRMPSREEWEKYHEYHWEFMSQSYRQEYNPH